MNTKTKNVTLKGALLLIGMSLIFMGYEAIQSGELGDDTFLKGVILIVVGIGLVIMREVIKKDVHLDGYIQSALDRLPEARREEIVQGLLDYLAHALSSEPPPDGT